MTTQLSKHIARTVILNSSYKGPVVYHWTFRACIPSIMETGIYKSYEEFSTAVHATKDESLFFNRDACMILKARTFHPRSNSWYMSTQHIPVSDIIGWLETKYVPYPMAAAQEHVDRNLFYPLFTEKISLVASYQRALKNPNLPQGKIYTPDKSYVGPLSIFVNITSDSKLKVNYDSVDISGTVKS
jgi:hypothetical protein